jgi:hypothetical protein
MFMDFRRDYNDGIVHIYDAQVLKEMKSFTNKDITETESGQSRITRHFDLLIATVIAWQMKDEIKEDKAATITYQDY